MLAKSLVLIISIAKALSGGPQGEAVLSPHQPECTARASPSLKGAAVKDSGLPPPSNSSHIYIPRPCAFIPRSPYLRPWAKLFFRRLSQGLLMRGGEGTLKILLPTLTQYPVLLHSEPSPSPHPTPESIKLPEPSVGASSTVRQPPCPCFQLTISWCTFPWGKME